MSHVLGIDVSRWQQKLNWKNIVNATPVYKDGSIAKDDEFVRFAYIKAVHGLSLDSEFIFNATESDIIPFRGFYLWFVPTLNPIKQANFFVDSIIRYYNELDLPPGVDVEDDAGGRVRGLALREAVKQCVEQIEDRIGRKVPIYTGKWFWQQAMFDEDDCWFARRPLWHSEYPGVIPGDGVHGHLPKPWQIRSIDEAIWQFDGDKGLYLPANCGDTGKPVDSDFNRFLGDEDGIVRFILDTFIDKKKLDWQPQTTPFAAEVDTVQLFPKKEEDKS